MESRNPTGTSRTSKKRYILLGLILALLLVVSWLFLSLRFYRAIGASMSPGIYENDLMICQSMGFTPRQGDIVVCQVDSYMPESFVKRVIAVGGQHVVIDYENNAVYVNGVPLEEPYVPEPMKETYAPFFTQNDIIVPEGFFYVLGDNRNHSVDSRDERLGCVSCEDILGKVLFVLPS